MRYRFDQQFSEVGESLVAVSDRLMLSAINRATAYLSYLSYPTYPT